MIRLIASDLDGTLLDNHKKITEEVYRAVADAAACGISFVPITGRPFGAVPKEVLTLPGVRYVAASSGAAVWDIKENKKIMEDLIPLSLMLEILDVLKTGDYPVMVFADGIGYVSERDMIRALEMAHDDEVRRYYRENRTVVPDLKEFLRKSGRDVEKFTVNFPYDDQDRLIGLEACRQLLEPYDDRLHPVYGGPINLEVGTKRAQKGEALTCLADSLGIKKEEIMAIGDSGNDVDMAGHAGILVAMGNASDEMKEKASFITLTNEESGVAYAVRKFALNEKANDGKRV